MTSAVDGGGTAVSRVVAHLGSRTKVPPAGTAGVRVIVPAILTLMNCPYSSSLSTPWLLACAACAATPGVTRIGIGALAADAGLASARAGKPGHGVSAARAA